MKDLSDIYSVSAVNDFLLYEPDTVQSQVGILLGNGCVSGDIARHAAIAYNKGLIKKIIITGGVSAKNPPLFDTLSSMNLPIIEGDFKTELSEADYMQSVLLTNGVNLSDIIYTERQATNTGENLEFIEPAMCAFNIKSATLFGVAYGAKRAFQTARRVMPDIKFYSHPVYPYGVKRNAWLNQWPEIDYIKNIIIAERKKLDPDNPDNYYNKGFCVPVNRLG
jgi:uncharacterized SAM-binding protein YcdF (DUF218 family)